MAKATPPSSSAYDGIVSRHLNRRFSRPVARLLNHTPATPNQVTVVSLLLATGSLALFAAGYPIVAGVLVQVCSIVDGVDGDLARLKGLATPFGSFFDAVVDRYADGMVLLGLTIWAADTNDGSLPWIAGFVALIGTFSVTYTRARIDATRRTMFDQGLSSLASRDVRLLMIMVGAVAGLGLQTLLAIAVLANVVVLLRLAAARTALRG